jgi:hypothetical protein
MPRPISGSQEVTLLYEASISNAMTDGHSFYDSSFGSRSNRFGISIRFSKSVPNEEWVKPTSQSGSPPTSTLDVGQPPQSMANSESTPDPQRTVPADFTSNLHLQTPESIGISDRNQHKSDGVLRSDTVRKEGNSNDGVLYMIICVSLMLILCLLSAHMMYKENDIDTKRFAEEVGKLSVTKSSGG